jgi:hypothetical protein
MELRVKSFVARHWCVPAASIGVEVQAVHGGLESAVGRARITQADRRCRIPAHRALAAPGVKR